MWQTSALVAMLCFAAMQLAFRYLSRKGIDSAAMLLLVFVFGALPYFVQVKLTRAPLPTDMAIIALLAGTGLLSYVGNLFSVRAVAAAPNPGYAVAIVGLQAAVVTLAASGLLGESMAWEKLLGVALCCAGIALLVV
jgi:drug/metabolite transporter (DMT)-like permease